MQLSVLCIDKKLRENFCCAFEKNVNNFKNNPEENRASRERAFWAYFLSRQLLEMCLI